jgi:transcriptional regulator GlxA family with amidase domain
MMSTKGSTWLSRREWLSASAVVGASLSVGNASAAQPTAAPLSVFPARTQPARVAFLIDERAAVIDFCGPWEAFQDASGDSVAGFDLFTVARSADPIQVSGGLRIVPDYTLANAPQPNVVVIPAQAGGRQDGPETHPKVEWLQHVEANADIVMSVCTGAFLLARTGLINGLSATTHHDFFDAFEQTFPQVHLVRGRRFVDNGKFISAGGLTSGIDAALHVVARYCGVDSARQTAIYMEHDGDGWLSGTQDLARRA